MKRKLPRNIKPDRLLKILLKMGFAEYKARGSHRRLRHPDGRWTQIAVHPGPIPQGTLRKILNQSGISIEELEKFY